MIESLGPDRPWSEFWDKACSREGQGQLGGIDIPMDEIACSGPLAQRFARFSVAFELMLRNRATEGEGDRRALGRGQRPEYRVVPVQPPNPPNKYTNDRRSYYWAGLFARLGELLRSRLHHRIPCAGASHRIRLEMVIEKAVSDISLFWIQQFQEIIPMRELADRFAV